MKLGAFLMPSHPPERSLGDSFRWDLDHLQHLDRIGFREAWIGEHYTVPWEPNPSPDLLIAQALLKTEQIILAPGAHLLPYHHPVELAHRVAFLDHIAQGRYMLGVGIGAIPTDQMMFGVDGEAGENRRMTAEALEIMLKIWTEGPCDYEGEFWSMGDPGKDHPYLRYHIEPFQKPHPPIGIAGLSSGSETLKLAGEKGFLPLSLALNPVHTATHWDSVMEGAARSGRTPDRSEWRLTREVYIAETDERARELARDGAMGRCWREYLLPFYLENGMGPHLKSDPDMPDSEITVDYLIENAWFVGSPDTVTAKLEKLQAETGGFGGMLVMIYDFSNEQSEWERSLQLLVDEVMPSFPE
jgi:alkanesulfonate monooxygenase SsuD/methylene tetrahydromethanopterin reductase-like flavin-dependent oxidoreductase (luciferase family)